MFSRQRLLTITHLRLLKALLLILPAASCLEPVIANDGVKENLGSVCATTILACNSGHGSLYQTYQS